MEAAMRRVLLGCTLLAIFCAGCGSTRSSRETAIAVTRDGYSQQAYITTATARVPAKQTAIAQRAPFIRDLNEAEQRWQAAGVMNYRIRSHFAAEIYVDETIEVRVENGHTTRENCTS